jgi:hypothetical protein
MGWKSHCKKKYSILVSSIVALEGRQTGGQAGRRAGGQAGRRAGITIYPAKFLFKPLVYLTSHGIENLFFFFRLWYMTVRSSNSSVLLTLIMKYSINDSTATPLISVCLKYVFLHVICALLFTYTSFHMIL